MGYGQGDDVLGLEEHGEVDGVRVVGYGPGDDALGAEGLGGVLVGVGMGAAGFFWWVIGLMGKAG